MGAIYSERRSYSDSRGWVCRKNDSHPCNRHRANQRGYPSRWRYSYSVQCHYPKRRGFLRPKTIRTRLEQMGADCDKIHIIDEDEKALSLSDARIEEAIARTNAKLCLLDPVQAYFGRANMNSANGVRPLMKRLGEVAARHGCSVLLVGHLHKKASKAAYAGLGSIDIFAAARSVLTVGYTNADENIRAIVQNKNNLAPAGKLQAFSIDPVSGFQPYRPRTEGQPRKRKIFTQQPIGKT